jgi:hypothetical protein
VHTACSPERSQWVVSSLAIGTGSLKGTVSRDQEGVLMIPVYGWDISVVPLEVLKIFKCRFPLKFVIIIELAVLH